jgi:hypothetical protein
MHNCAYASNIETEANISIEQSAEVFEAVYVLGCTNDIL